MSSTSTSGRAIAVGALRQLERGAGGPSSPGAASRCRRRGRPRPDCARRTRHLPRVVARVPLLLVGRIVLLVDHDQPEIAHRREHGRPGADADHRLARAQPVPLVAALAGRQPGVKERHADRRTAAANLETVCGARAISGTSTIVPRPRAERRLGSRQVHLRLPRSGHAVEQELGVLGSVDRAGDRAERRRLRGVERRPARPGAHVDDRGTPRALRRPKLHHPTRLHPPKSGEIGAGGLEPTGSRARPRRPRAQ